MPGVRLSSSPGSRMKPLDTVCPLRSRMMFGAPMAIPSPRQPRTSSASLVLSVMTWPQVTTVASAGTGWRAPGGGVSAASKRSSSNGSVISGGSCGSSREAKLWSPPSGSLSTWSRMTQPWFGLGSGEDRQDVSGHVEVAIVLARGRRDRSRALDGVWLADPGERALLPGLAQRDGHEVAALGVTLGVETHRGGDQLAVGGIGDEREAEEGARVLRCSTWPVSGILAPERTSSSVSNR